MSSNARHRLDADQAERIGIDALAFLAQEPEQLGRFLVATGIGPGTLRASAAEPGFLAGVLEFIMADETLVLVFAERQRIRPTMIAAARLMLATSAGDES